MILQRLASAIRNQNWSQIITEILIVIVGIFLGLQVQAWYENQQDHIQERAFLVRLHNELQNVEASIQGYQEINFSFEKLFEEALDALAGKGDVANLDNSHCFMISASHIYIGNSTPLPTMTELISSGQLSTISDQELRNAIANYVIQNDRSSQLLTGFYSDRLELSSKHPELIAYRYGGNFDTFEGSVNASCDFDAMQNSQAFINDLLMNARRVLVYNEGEFESFHLIQQIHSRVDEILGITHSATK